MKSPIVTCTPPGILRVSGDKRPIFNGINGSKAGRNWTGFTEVP